MGRKRTRSEPKSVWDKLDWRSVEADLSLFADETHQGLTGMIQLQECDGTNYKTMVVGSKISSAAEVPPMDCNDSEKIEGKRERSGKSDKNQKRKQVLPIDGNCEAEEIVEEETEPIDMSAWDQFELHEPILKGLAALKFDNPTEIQSRLIQPLYKYRKDVIAAAQTGSGKTLAFGLPLLNRILDETDPKLSGLILSPTRELAIQIMTHLEKAARFTSIKIACCVGGLAMPRQKRLICQNPQIVVATPGRLWDILQDASTDPDLKKALDLSSIRFLVVDEADRMVSHGHYQELDKILGRIYKQAKAFQTVLLSATMTSTCTRSKPKTARSTCATSTLDNLVKRIEFQGKPEIHDLSTKTRVASNITEGRISCLPEEKDMYAYYFLLRSPGRTMVFANSIACVRRFHAVFSLLDIPVYPLHASMQQRQRLKNLDRFRSLPNCVLICTDVAARGIDITDVDNVLHYQVSPSSDVYVHRSGRTGRANNAGFSLILISPNEMSLYNKQVRELNHKISEFHVDMKLLDPMRKRVSLAIKLDKLLSTDRKSNAEKNWFEKQAAELDMIVDDELISSDKTKGNDGKKKRAEIRSLREALESELEKPLVPKGVSRQFVTVTDWFKGGASNKL